jgi:Txe/YoeB family toxin of Txe-Axe toxin-antitoxin module
MPKIHYDPSFLSSYKQFIRRNAKLRQRINQKLLIFEKNPSHPSFHIEKLVHTEVWSIRLDKGNRLFFFWNKTKDTAIFFFVGSHDAYKTIGKK